MVFNLLYIASEARQTRAALSTSGLPRFARNDDSREFISHDIVPPISDLWNDRRYPRLRLAFFRVNIPRMFTLSEKMVPEGGFEPPTRGFSIRCSTPELLGPPPKVQHMRFRCAAYRERKAPLASAKSVLVITVHAVFVFRRGTGHFIAIPQPLQQVTVFAPLAAKRCMCCTYRFLTESTFGISGKSHGIIWL